MIITTIKSDEQERRITGAAVRETQVADDVFNVLSCEDFNEPACHEIMQILYNMRRQNLFISLDAVLGGLSQEKEYLASHIADFNDVAATRVEVPVYLEKIAGLSSLRKIQRALIESLYDVQENIHEPANVISRCETAIFKATETRSDVDIRSMKDVMGSTREKILDTLRLKNEGIPIDRISLGLQQLDEYTAGLKAGQLVVIAARPGVGKTVIGLQSILCNAAKGKSVGVVTLEMAAEELTCRALASDSKVSLTRIIECDFDDSRKFGEEQSILIMNSMDSIEKLPIWFVDCPSLKSGQLRAKARRLKAKYKIELLMVDYLQLLEADEKNKNRTLEVAEIVRTLKSIARELQIPVIALAQLNRHDGEPTLNNLRESGEIEAAADVIILLHKHEETPDSVTSSNHPTKMNVAKNRSGKSGPIETILEGRFCRFKFNPNWEDPKPKKRSLK